MSKTEKLSRRWLTNRLRRLSELATSESWETAFDEWSLRDCDEALSYCSAASWFQLSTKIRAVVTARSSPRSGRTKIAQRFIAGIAVHILISESAKRTAGIWRVGFVSEYFCRPLHGL